MSYYTTKPEHEPLGIQGFILLFCVLELFIALFHPIIQINIVGITEVNLIIFVLFIISILQVALLRAKIPINRLDILILIYAAYCFYSTLFSTFINEYRYAEELFALKNYLNPIIIYFLLKTSISSKKQVKVLIAGLGAVLVFGSAISLLGYFFWTDALISRGRITGIFGNVNLFGMFVLTYSPIIILFFRPEKKAHKIIKGIAIAIIMIALIQTGSRGAFLGQCVVFASIIIESKHKFKGIILGGLAIAGLAIFVSFSPFQGEDVFSRLEVGEDEGLAEFSSGRWDLWPPMMKEYLKKPVFGYGFNSFSREYSIKHLGRPVASHNEYINLLFTLGLTGFALFGLINSKIWLLLKRNSHLLLARACRYGITGYFVHITFTNPVQMRYFFWVLFAITLRSIEFDKSKEI